MTKPGSQSRMSFEFGTPSRAFVEAHVTEGFGTVDILFPAADVVRRFGVDEVATPGHTIRIVEEATGDEDFLHVQLLHAKGPGTQGPLLVFINQTRLLCFAHAGALRGDYRKALAAAAVLSGVAAGLALPNLLAGGALLGLAGAFAFARRLTRDRRSPWRLGAVAGLVALAACLFLGLVPRPPQRLVALPMGLAALALGIAAFRLWRVSRPQLAVQTDLDALRKSDGTLDEEKVRADARRTFALAERLMRGAFKPGDSEEAEASAAVGRS